MAKWPTGQKKFEESLFVGGLDGRSIPSRDDDQAEHKGHGARRATERALGGVN